SGQSLGDLFGDSAAARIGREGRRTFAFVRDSLAHVEGRLSEPQRQDAVAIANLRFDDRSFSLSDQDGSPTVTFAVPGRGPGRVGDGIALEPVVGSAAPWWTDIRDGRPATDADGTDRWGHPGYTVIARYDSAGEVATVSLTDSTHREWPITTVSAP